MRKGRSALWGRSLPVGVCLERIVMLIRAPVLTTSLPSGVQEIAADRQWDYAWTVDPTASPFRGQLRLRLRARVLQGEMGFASLNRSRDQVFHEFVLPAGGDWTEFDVILPCYDDFGGVVARNTGSQGPARAELALVGAEQAPANLFLLFLQEKLASQTIEAALRRIIPGESVERHHFLSGKAVRRAKEETAKVLSAGRGDAVELYYAGPHGQLEQALASERAVAKYQQRVQNGNVWIVTGVRNPLSRSMASFFQNISTFCPWLTFERQNLGAEVERALAYYHEVFKRAQAGTLRDHVEQAASTKIMLQPARWFEEEFTRLTNVSVYDAPLQDEGFCTFESGGVSILFYRFEALPEILPRMLRAMDLCPVQVESVNIGRKKQSGGLYEAFKERFEPTFEMQEYFLGNKFAERFYPLSWQRTMHRSRIARLGSVGASAGSEPARDPAELVRAQMNEHSQGEQATASAEETQIRLCRRVAAADEEAERQRRNALALEADNEELRAQLQRGRSELQDLLADNDRLQRDGAKLAADADERREQQARLEGEREQLKALLVAANAALVESGARVESLRVSVLTYQAEIDELRAENARAQGERDAMSEGLHAERTALTESFERGERLEAQMAALELSNGDLRSQSARSQAECDALTEMLASERVALKERDERAERLHLRVLALETDNNELLVHNARLQGENVALNQVRASERALLEASHERVERLQIQASALRAEYAQLDAQRADLLTNLDELHGVIAAERGFVDDHIRHGELLEAQVRSAGAEVERLSLALDAAGRQLAEQERAISESLQRGELARNQLEATILELTDAKTALQEARNANAVSESMVLEAVREQVASLVRVMRSEDMAVVRREYENLLASQAEALNESHARAEAQHRELLEAVPEIVHLQTGQDVHDAVAALVAERTRREAAEELARALEKEHVERMREVGALAKALEEQSSRLQCCEEELVACKAVLERSRYLRARRAVLRLLGRGSASDG